MALNSKKMSKKTQSFGQIVIGPPGSGKTTYCKGMTEFLTKMGRKVAVVNMDPANDSLPYDCSIDISDLVTLSEVMECLKLGPNGGLIYCMEFLEKNFSWFQNKLKDFSDAGYYFLFDCPGQVELYTHHDSVRQIFQNLEKYGFRLVAVHLVDSHYCSDPGKFISVLLTSLSTMLQIGLPHVNVLSKMDLIQQYGKLPFNLDFFTDVLDLSYLVEMFDKDPFLKKYKKLNKALTDVIEDYGLVSFSALCIEDKETMLSLVKLIDKASGYVFGIKGQDNMASMMSCAAGADFDYFVKAGVQEKYVDNGEDVNMEQQHSL
ncbi:GPN-loop GTPase 2-like isoform X2 [Rhopilema esculentum]|uniref:GPN-loop GTPase 2-like isoform X2 n=1 Tax=Rhopilema esculentum TaxID=499914 RepID=UPI0031E4330C